MGITINYTFLNYTFLPENVAPRQDPLTAHNHISQAADIAIPVLQGRRHTLRTVAARPQRNGLVSGDPLLRPRAARRTTAPGLAQPDCRSPLVWRQFSKTQYASDFARAHIAHCEALMALVAAGPVAPDIEDEGGYLPNRNPKRLDLTHQQMAAMMGAIGYLLPRMNIPHHTKTPGGDIYEFRPDRPGQASDADTEKVACRFRQAAANIRGMDDKPA